MASLHICLSAGGSDGLRKVGANSGIFKRCGAQWTVFVSHFLFSSSTVVEHMLNQSKIFGGRHNKTKKYTCIMLVSNICAHD